METTISAAELAQSLGDILHRVQDHGERFIIEQRGEPIAALEPIAVGRPITLRELAVQLGSLAMPGDGFADDLEAIQTTQPLAPPPA
jgi:antitoxin (DNA-binding transcriptional repressor) of toxin-antitoxin stability system